jgi:ubiquinone/menaquinone biosynthesis C-methylase UbiE
MTRELLFQKEAAAEYDRAFVHVTRYFMPLLLRAADVTPGRHVLDIATGTGSEAALAAPIPAKKGRCIKTTRSHAQLKILASRR